MAINKTTAAAVINAQRAAAERACNGDEFVIRNIALGLALELDTHSEAERFIARCGYTNAVLPLLARRWREATEGK